MKKYLWIMFLFLTTAVNAEPTTDWVKITQLRPYNMPTAAVVYMSVDKTSVCDTNTYVIDLSWVGGKEIYAMALAAVTSGKPVKVEVVNIGCATPNWTTKVQSLYMGQQ
jgi:hypothetical protein